jgi:hypothetical protein
MYTVKITYRSTNNRLRSHRGHYQSRESVTTAIATMIKAGNKIIWATAIYCPVLGHHH